VGVTFFGTRSATNALLTQRSTEEKTGPLRARFSFAGKTGNHLPEGNSWLHRDHHLGGTAIVCLQRNRSICLIM